ncbi:MMPL family transporter [Terrabacter terrae]|uniref:MMPL family transporter n=1 Tax=Terrabacter terrae TaxID=318434 RepID=UPI0031D5328B
MLAQVGVIICVGVLLDTLVVRTLLVPAIAVVLGDRFWWPRRPHPTQDPVKGADAATRGRAPLEPVGAHNVGQTIDTPHR